MGRVCFKRQRKTQGKGYFSDRLLGTVIVVGILVQAFHQWALPRRPHEIIIPLDNSRSRTIDTFHSEFVVFADEEAMAESQKSQGKGEALIKTGRVFRVQPRDVEFGNFMRLNGSEQYGVKIIGGPHQGKRGFISSSSLYSLP